LLAEIDLALKRFCASVYTAIFEVGSFAFHWARTIWGLDNPPSAPGAGEEFLNLFEEEAVPRFPLLRRSVIYGDAKHHNALVEPKKNRVSP